MGTRATAALYTALVLLSSGCSGGALPAGNSTASGTNAEAPGSVRHREVKVNMRFKIPRRLHGHQAHYVSPATASIEVTAFDATHTHQLAQAGVNTTPGAGGCTAVSHGTFGCTLRMAVPPGHDTFDVDAYDAAGESGHRLSATSDFAFDVVAGKANALAMTLGGIPVSVTVTLVGGSPFATGSATSGFQFGGIGIGAKQQLQLTAADVDGYTIVSPGAPVLTLTSGVPAKLSVAAVPGSPGLFNLTPLVETNALPSPNPSPAVSLTATATPVGTGTAPLAVETRVQNDPIAYVASQDNASVQAYAPWNAAPVLTLALASDPGYPALAIDPLGNVYISDYTSETIAVYRRGATTAARTITGIGGVYFVVVDAAGDIFSDDFGSVLEFAPSGGNTPSRTLSGSSIDEPYGLALDASGNLYVANCSGTVGVSVFAPGKATTPVLSFANGMDCPEYPVFDPSGNLYVSNYSSDTVTEYKPPFSKFGASPSATPSATFGSSATLDSPLGIAIDGPGNVYVANNVGDDAIEFAPGAPKTAARTLTSSGAKTESVVVDTLGNAYVPWESGTVSVYAPGSSTTPIGTWTAGIDAPFVVAIWP